MVISILSNFKDFCQDISIIEGMMRQRNNDRSVMFELNLVPLFGDATIFITGVKDKIELFKMFQHQDTISVNVEDNAYVISDGYSALKIMMPSKEFVGNEFIKEEVLSKIVDLNDDNLMADYDINRTLLNRIRTASNSFGVSMVALLFGEKNMSIVASTKSRDQEMRIVKDIDTIINFEKNKINVSIVPFCIDYESDLNMMLYVNRESRIATLMFSSRVGGIDIKIWSRSDVIST